MSESLIWYKVKRANNPEILLTCKAWNGRVVCEWLAFTVKHAAQQFDPDFDHGCLALACVAAILAMKKLFWSPGNFYMILIWKQPLYTDMRKCDPPSTRCPSSKKKPRTAMAKWFWLQETNPRHLTLGSDHPATSTSLYYRSIGVG